MRRIVPILFIITLVMSSAPTASASPGSLDPTFDSAGWVATHLGGAEAIAMATGSEITVLAQYPNFVLTLLRYQLDGSLDTAFSGDGIVEVPFRGVDLVAAMVVDPQGRVIVMALIRAGMRLERFLPNGTIDQAFGDAGSVTIKDLFLGGMALQPDGKILLVGKGTQVVILRLRGNGTLDPSFGHRGLVRIGDLGGANDGGIQVATLQTGKIMVLAEHRYHCSGQPCQVKSVLIRLNPDGSKDLTYGTGGEVRWNFRVHDFDPDPIHMALGSRGHVVVLMAQGGVSGCPSGGGNGLVEFRRDGAIADRFGTHGRIKNLTIDPTDLAVQADGRIVVSGSYCALTTAGWQMNFSLVRVLPTGLMDASFEDNGLSAPRLGTVDSRAMAVGLQPDGKIVLAGEGADSSVTPTTLMVVIARYLTA